MGIRAFQPRTVIPSTWSSRLPPRRTATLPPTLFIRHRSWNLPRTVKPRPWSSPSTTYSVRSLEPRANNSWSLRNQSEVSSHLVWSQTRPLSSCISNRNSSSWCLRRWWWLCTRNATPQSITPVLCTRLNLHHLRILLAWFLTKILRRLLNLHNLLLKPVKGRRTWVR